MGQGDSFAPGDALRNVDILYVDGETHRRDLMRRLLLSMGAQRVQVAETGPEALKVVLGSTCGLVITEEKIAPKDGITLIRQIRSATNYPRALVPILMLSDPVGPNVVAAALDAGANHFLVRPISPAKLYERIERTVGDTRPFIVRNGQYVIKPPLAKLLGQASPRRATAPAK